jgi:hypothetical protein
MSPDMSLVTALFLLLAGVLVTAGVTVIIETKQYKKGTVVIAVGLGCFLFGWYWNTLRSKLGERFVALVENIASDARIWFGLIIVIMLYAMTDVLISKLKKDKLESIVKEDIPALNAAIRAYALPRGLTPHQVTTIAKCLSDYPPFKVKAKIRYDDSEAQNYWADLQRAIERGGWSVESFDHPAEGLREGLWVEASETTASAQTPHGPHNPKAFTLLTQALTEANVSFEQGRSVSPETEANELIISVGRRRRDALQPHLSPD